MPKRPLFAFKKTPKGWLVNVPGSVSESGQRERRYFKTRDKAKEETQRLAEAYKKHGESSSTLPPRKADDAASALQMLSRFSGISLCDAARFYTEHHDLRSRAPTLRKAWEDGINLRKNHRPVTLSDFKAWQKALPDAFLDKNVMDITPAMIVEMLEELTDGETRRENGVRYISAILGDCVRSSMLPSNPCSKVKLPRKREQDDEVSIYTPKQLSDLLSACRDYSKGMDKKCASCAVPFAILAFAGLRPAELLRLSWDNIDLELGVIRLGSSMTKRARRRNVRVQPTLRAWIETVPIEQRVDRIVPGRWRYKAARVRREAGIDGHEMADALRHSFGTYMLATENDLDALKSDMGHEHVRVFFNHYHKAMMKKEALPYWKVLPPGVELPQISVA